MKLCVLLALVLIIGVTLTSCSGSPRRRSEQNIRERILHDTPLGSAYAVVLDYAKSKGRPVTEQPEGYVVPEIGKSQAQSKIVGKRVIRAYL